MSILSPGRLAARVALATGLVLVALWLAAVTGHAASVVVARTVVILAAGAVLVWISSLLRRALAPENRPDGPLLLAVLVAALVFGFAGLAHEVGQGYYTDEGHYLHKARVVDSGKLFTKSFVYPHLTYYLDAFALWLAGLFPGLTASLCRTVFGVTDPAAVDWMVLRVVTASLGTATVLPVFFLARRLAGPGRLGSLAAGLSSALVIFAVDYQNGFQVNISDVPSAFFATWTMAVVGRLLERERFTDYLAAGVLSGLAAAAKYPAGVVAVAIAGIWVAHRIRTRRWSFGLLGAGLVSLGAFLLMNPSVFVHAEALLAPRGVLFGVKQYAEGGWVGVTPPSIPLFYGKLVMANFGFLAVVLGVAGFFVLPRDVRRRLFRLLPFPVAFLVLICSMNMVVVRNLFPVLPALAVVFGTGAAALLLRLGETVKARGRRAIVAGLAVLVLAQPATAVAVQTTALVRPSTRDLMSAWILEHLPRGTGILKEEYTPNFPGGVYRTVERRFAFRIPEERFDDPRFDVLLLAGHAYGRFFNPDNDAEHRADWYREIFDSHELVHEVRPGRFRRGPELRFYRLPPPALKPVARRVFAPGEAFLEHRSMRRTQGEIGFTHHGEVAVFRGDLAAGAYRVRILGETTGEGRLVVRDLADLTSREAAVEATLTDGAGTFALDRAGRYLLELSLPRGSRAERWVVEGE